jgi:hypothetical protein
MWESFILYSLVSVSDAKCTLARFLATAEFLFRKINTFALSLSLFCLPKKVTKKGHGCRETLRFGLQPTAARKKTRRHHTRGLRPTCWSRLKHFFA